jgi:formiminotetrahydrofolate cyclodeaminase
LDALNWTRIAALARATRARRHPPQLTGAIDEDTGAYDQVVAAYSFENGRREGGRKAAVQQAHAATDVRSGSCAFRAGDAANIVASHGHRGASSDVGWRSLLRAGLHGARLNVDINLGGIADEPYKQAVEAGGPWCSRRQRRRGRRARHWPGAEYNSQELKSSEVVALRNDLLTF